jgi:NitT/TauT family transport system substrate-binding protein
MIVTVFAMVGLVAGCVPLQTEDTSLKVGLLPVLDVLPLYVAEQNGYFADEGIQVEAVPVKSAQERDVLLQTGQADGVLTDLPSTALFNQDTARVKAVYTSRRPYPDAPMFRILAGPGTELSTPSDLSGVPVGISQNTVIEYLTDRILEAEGVLPEDVAVLEVSAIPVRFEQLMNGNIQAATLPDPLASAAMAAGAKLIADDSQYPEVAQSVLTFSTDALTAKPGTVRKFLAAWNKAVAELNANPEKYGNLLIEQARVPEAVRESYQMPPFPEAGVPTEAEVADIVQWMQEKGLLKRAIPYQELVDPSFLPK